MTRTVVGLSSAEAGRRLAHDGPNELPQPRAPSRARQLLRQFTHLLALLLWAAAGLALLAGLPPLSAAIVVVVVLNAVFAFAQEHRADRAAERLRSLLPVLARVRRDGSLRTVEARELVRGDLVLLGPGDRVAADLRLLAAHTLALDESLLTGESEPVHRDAGERVLAGTFVTQGEAEAVVEQVGARTELAGIAALTRQAHRPPSPLTVQLHRVVQVVAVVAVSVGAVLAGAAVALGLHPTDAFLFGVGVAVALVPEGLLPTVTLSLARGAQLMADRNALVRRLEAVETLGATTFICTDKTGTLTQNRMGVVEIWTPAGSVAVDGLGYAPDAVLHGAPTALEAARGAAGSAVRCVAGRAVIRDGEWVAEGDPMEAALHAWALRTGAVPDGPESVRLRLPYTAERMLSSVVIDDDVHVLGAPEAVLSRCTALPRDAPAAVDDLTGRGRRVLAVAHRDGTGPAPGPEVEHDLRLLAVVGLEDPPRPDVSAALQSCREADITVAMVTGDHPATAAAIAREVGLLRPGGAVLDGSALPADDADLADALDNPNGAVVARVMPADKLRIARVLRSRGHVVAMTGDGVNDAPALREADVGVAMGMSGSDVTREAADLVLLDDHFGTIVAAIELGRATFANIRRFLTYHLTDNVAELAPFAVWAMTAGQVPLAIGVLQVLALDIGTDMLPALALGAEPPSKRAMKGRAAARNLIDAHLLRRAFGVLGATEAVVSVGAFLAVLLANGWRWGDAPAPVLLAAASGTAFATIALAQMANAAACRSETVPAWRVHLAGNPFIVAAVLAELALLVAFVGLPPVADLLGGSWPPPLGWSLALLGSAVLLLVDAGHKRLRAGTRPGTRAGTFVSGSGRRAGA